LGWRRGGGARRVVGIALIDDGLVFGGHGGQRGLGSFCPFRDGGEWREYGDARLGLGLEGVAEGAVGLEDAELAEAAEEGALGAGVVAGQTLDGGFGVSVGEGIAILGQVGFEAADALEVPGGEDELVEEALLDHALGLEVGLVGGEEVFEFLEFVLGDDDLAGREAVFAGVLAAASLALGGLGTGG